MTKVYIAPHGSAQASGDSEASPISLPELMSRGLRPGMELFLRADADHHGTLELFECHDGLTIDRYGHGREPRVLSGERNGLYYTGSNLKVRNVAFVGRGGLDNSGVWLGNGQGSGINNIFENVSCTGYAQAGFTFSASGGLLAGITLNRCHAFENGNGFHFSGGDPAIYQNFCIQNLRMDHCVAVNNDWHSSTNAGFGFSLNQVHEFKLKNCQALSNGLLSHSPGHAGFLINFCDLGKVSRCLAFNNRDDLPGGGGDGQGFVNNNTSDTLYKYCRSSHNKGGYAIRTEHPGPQEAFQVHVSKNVRILGCSSEYDETGLAIYNEAVDSLVHNLHVLTRVRMGGYGKCVDLYDHTGSLVVQNSHFEIEQDSEGFAHLVEVSGQDRGLNVAWPGTTWKAPSPSFQVHDMESGFRSFREWQQAIRTVNATLPEKRVR